MAVGRPSLSNGKPSSWKDIVCPKHLKANQKEPPKTPLGLKTWLTSNIDKPNIYLAFSCHSAGNCFSEIGNWKLFSQPSPWKNLRK